MNKILKTCTDTNNKLEAIYKPNGELTKNAEETLEVMTQTHFRESVTDPPVPPLGPIPITSDLLDKIYSPERIEKALMSFDPLKAAGPDTLKPIIFQKAWNHIKVITQNIMTNNHKTQHIPTLWRDSIGIFLPKPGKTDYNKAKSFRTITLSPVMLKLQEKVILWHMQHDLNIANDINKRQFGFRKGCSTEAALHKVTHTIERRIAKKGYVLGVFLDIEGAFDNVSFKAISEAVRATKVDLATAQWIINMVTNRFITLSHKDKSRRVQIRRGCPQGGILSPFLWNLVVDDLLSFTAKDIPGYLQAFADDLVSLAEGNDLDIIWNRTCKTIKTIEKWCQTKDLSISALKTQIVMFTWNTKWTLRPIKVGNNIIGLSKSAKFLGVTLDSKLNFNEHIINITKKATASLMQCRRAVGPTWGMSPKTCKWMFTAVIRPILSYCCSIWIRATDTDYNARKLKRVQALALRMMSGAMPSTPFLALNHITNTPDTILFLRGEAAKGAARLQAYGSLTLETIAHRKGTIKNHTTINKQFMEDLNIPPRATRDLTAPTMMLGRHFTVTTPGTNNTEYRSALQHTIDNITSETITCYTDGSLSDSGSGAGYIITTDNNNTTLEERSFKLPDYCTVYQTELTAIIEACKYLSSYTNSHIIIWSDSLSSIQAISSLSTRSRTTRDCYDTLNALGSNNTLEIRWIAAHIGLWGNEKADELAKLGTTSELVLKCPIPQSYIKRQIDNKVHRLNQDIWLTDGPRHTKLTLGQKHTKIINNINTSLINNRQDYRTAVHLITGHCGLNKHLHTIRKSSTSACPMCGDGEETVSHFLGQCPAIAQLRGQYFRDYYLSVNDIFDNHHITTIVNFANRTKRLIVPEELDQTGVT